VSVALVPAAQPAPAAAPALERLSASRLKCWQQCRRRFALRYVHGLEKPVSPALFLGRFLHRMVQLWNLQRWREGKVSEDDLLNHFVAEWQAMAGADTPTWKDGEENGERARALALLACWVKEAPIPVDERPQGVEVRLEMESASHPPLIGILDLVRADGTVTDFKTSARTTSPDQLALQHRVQMLCYAMLYRESTWEVEAGFEIIELVKTKEPKVVVTRFPAVGERDLAELDEMIASYLEGVRNRDFVPSYGPHCSWCEYRRECLGGLPRPD
jgi:putative RecB family exonuclease